MRAHEDLSRVRRVLVLRHRAAGDLLLTTPALRALRAGLPQARIDVLVSRGMRGLLEENPDVDHVIEIDRTSVVSQLRHYTKLLAGRYDLVLDMVSNPRSAFMAALTRAPIRVGFDLQGRSWAYTVRVPREPIGPSGPVVRYAPEASLDLVRAIGIAPRGMELTFQMKATARDRMDAWLRSHGLGSRTLVACLPAGTWATKTWLPERFSEVMDRLHGSADVVWLWGPGEEPLARACQSRMKEPSTLAPPTTWEELAALLTRSSLLVSNDSGPKHLAIALGIPTVTIFGPTNPGAWQPSTGPHVAVEATGLPCLHCNETRCPLPGDRFMRCMRDVTVDQVVSVCRTRLQERAGAPA